MPFAFLEPVDDPLGDLIGRYARTHRPFTATQAAATFHLPPAVISDVLARLTEQGRVVEGQFTPGEHAAVEYVDAELLRRIRRRSLAALRAAVEPVSPPAYALLLAQWQGVLPRHQHEGTHGLAEVMTQLSGVSAPLSAWESLILPARVTDYRPSMLDEL